MKDKQLRHYLDFTVEEDCSIFSNAFGGTYVLESKRITKISKDLDVLIEYLGLEFTEGRRLQKKGKAK